MPTRADPGQIAVVSLGITALLYLSESPAIFAGAVGLLVALFCLSPAAGILATAFTIPLVFQPISAGGAQFAPAELLVVSTSVGFVVSEGARLLASTAAARAARIRYLAKSLGRGFGPTAVALFAIGALSLVTVADPSHRQESIREFRWVILEPVALYFVTRWTLANRQERVRLLWFFCAGALLSSAWALAAFATGSGVRVEGVTRVSGPYPHPNGLALYLERAVIVGIVMTFAFVPRQRWRWSGAAAISGVALLLTFSRGAWLSVLVIVLVALGVAGRRRLALGLAGLGMVSLAVLAFAFSERVGSLFDGGSGSLRIAVWRSSLDMVRDYPFFGVGLDQFLYQYLPRYVRPEAWAERFTSHPHNIILDVWLRLGIMGLAAAIAFLVAWFRSAHRCVRSRSPLGLAAAAAISASFVHGLVDNGYFLADLALTVWLLSAVLEGEASHRIAEN